MELGVLAILLGATALILVRGWTRLAFFGSTVAVLCLLWMEQAPSAMTENARYRPDELADRTANEYTSSDACRSCHPSAYASWYRSYHRTMTQPAGPQSVLGQFDGRILKDSGREYRVFKHGEQFYVDMPAFGTEGRTEAERLVRPVVMTTGSHHMQAYWIPVPQFSEAIPASQRAGFKALCSSCHGSDGRGAQAPGLVDASLSETQIEEGLNSPAHRGIDRNQETFGPAVAYAKAIQYTGRLAQFPFVYLIKEDRWAHEDHTFLQAPDPLDEGEPYGDRWSDGCDQCHSVRPSFTWVPGERVGNADIVELGIACEACHGPGKAHIAKHQAPLSRYSEHLDDDAIDDIVNPSKLDHRRASHVCAQCHAELVIAEESEPFLPGHHLEGFGHVVQYLPESPPRWLSEHLVEEPSLLNDAFWRDGTMRVAGRDFNALAITGCYTRGEMSCLSCHSMHSSDPNDQLKPKARGDAVCVECHPKEGDDIEAHTYHPADSAGSRCYNCHMPHTTIGLLGVIRAHRVDSPNATTHAESGRPDACSLCHLDKPLAEIAQHLTRWYGQAPLSPSEEHTSLSSAVVGILKGDAVVRATYAWHMGWGPAQEASGTEWMPPFLAEILDDPYSSVRFGAAKSLKTMPGFAEFKYDYIGTAESYQDATERARSQWAGSVRELSRPNLMIHAGQPDFDAIEAIKRNRDDTPVRVNE